jgi:hypothetical protein
MCLFAVNGEADGSTTVVGVQTWDRGEAGTNVFETFPHYTEE